jgi:hypothetical protein
MRKKVVARGDRRGRREPSRQPPPPLPHLSRGPRESLKRPRGDPGGAANALHSCLTRATGEPTLRRVTTDPGARGRGAPSQLTRGTGEPKRAPASRRVSKSPAQHAYPGHRGTALTWVSRWPWCCARVGRPPALAAPVLLPGAGRPPTPLSPRARALRGPVATPQTPQAQAPEGPVAHPLSPQAQAL